MSLKSLTDSVMAANETQDKWSPPAPDIKKSVNLKWNGREWNESLRLMTPTERLTRDRICAGFIGVRTGASAESFPNYRYWHALATLRTLWPDMPEWVDWIVSNHPTLPVELLEQVEAFEDSFREAARIYSVQEEGGPILSIS